MKKVLITGAGGFVGKYLIKEFKNNGYTVIACDINCTDKFEKDVTYYDMNILDKKIIEDILEKEKPDYLVNLAAISSVGLSWKIPEDTIKVNAIGTINILDAIKNIVPKCKCLFIGSSEEYIQKNEPLKEDDDLEANNPYGISKITAENIAKMYANTYGLNIVCTRSFNHTGIGQADNFAIPSFCKQVAEASKKENEHKIYVGNLSAYRDLSDVEYVVRAYRVILEKSVNGFDIFNVGSGKARKISEILDTIISFSNENIEIVIDENRIRKADTSYICADTTKLDKIMKDENIENNLDNVLKKMFEFYCVEEK